MITVERIGKEYQVGEARSTETFRELLADLFSAPRRRESAANQTKRFWALKDVSFTVHQGEVVGVIGRNGAGKSTLLKILSRVTEPSEGRAIIRGRVSSLLEVGTGFHPEMTGRENIYLNGAILGMRLSEIRAEFDRIVDFAEVESFLDTPVKRYSSGMYVRLAFAVAAHLRPEILFVDEVLAVGDADFQSKCLSKMSDAAKSGRTILFVSHNLHAIERLCHRVVVLDKGRVSGIYDTPREGIGFYLGGDSNVSNVWTNSGSECLNGYFTPHRLEIASEAEYAVGGFSSAGAIKLVIDGIVHEADPALQIGLRVYDEAEQIMFTTWSTDSAEENWPRLEEGSVRLALTIPPRWLNEGNYRVELLATLFLRVWLIEPGTSAFVNFAIQGGANASPYWVKREGVLAPVLEWHKIEEKPQ
jgi:lipopolysaccharide transport system ATP-binding protein